MVVSMSEGSGGGVALAGGVAVGGEGGGGREGDAVEEVMALFAGIQTSFQEDVDIREVCLMGGSIKVS